MTSTTKEQRRRAAIEATWETPAPIKPAHDPEPGERPLNAQRALDTLAGHGFQVEEKAAIVYDLPRWRTVNPDDPNLSYVAEPLEVYHLKAYSGPCNIGVQVMYLGGKVARSWLGHGTMDGDGAWASVPIASLAKTIREALNTQGQLS